MGQMDDWLNVSIDAIRYLDDESDRTVDEPEEEEDFGPAPVFIAVSTADGRSWSEDYSGALTEVHVA